MKAVYLDYASLDQQDLDFQALHAAFDPLVLYPTTSAAEIASRVAEVEVIISNKVLIDAATIQQSPELKLILISATGSNNVDLAAAKARGIVVCNCQAYGTSAVAQHTLMLMLNLATSFLSYQRALQQGQWQNLHNSVCWMRQLSSWPEKHWALSVMVNWAMRWRNWLKLLA